MTDCPPPGPRHPPLAAGRNPRQFVITTDRDFREKLIDPLSEGVSYALVTGPEASQADAVSQRFPGIFADGGGVARLDREWVDGRGAQWRIYIFDY